MENNVYENLRKAQLHCVGILEDIDAICRENNINYSLNAGTVIGWHLYGGFVPWDDDIDLMMTRDNYEKFLSVCKTKLPKKYELRNFENGKDKRNLFSKIVDTQTTYIDCVPDCNNVITGVYIDISVFDKYPKNNVRRFFYKMLIKLLYLCVSRGKIKTQNVKEFFREFLRKVLKPFSKKIYIIINNIFSQYSPEEYDYAEVIFGLTNVFPREIFESYKDVLFEGKKAMIVEDYMGYLESRYGRREFYKEQRDGDAPPHLLYVDCETPYSEYKGEFRKSI